MTTTPSVSQLTLVPTHFERELLASFATADKQATLAVCGLGMALAGIHALRLIQQHHPQSVLLIGIAGALDDQLAVGSAYEFSSVACYGIGVGCGQQYQTIGELGWESWLNPCPDQPTIAEVLPLAIAPPADATQQPARQLLSVTAASSNANQIVWKREKFPLAVAEDMESYAVALACRLSGIPLRVIRGISNRAGDRQRKNWRISEALQSAVSLIAPSIKSKPQCR